MNHVTEQNAPRIVPRFSMSEDVLYCDQFSLDLNRRPLTRRLIRTFLARPDQFITRRELVEVVYGNFDVASKSLRFREALKQNITKMVSRVRALTEEAFNQRGEPWIEMFVYIPEGEGWCFFRLKNTYLKQREAELRQLVFDLGKTASDKSEQEAQAA